jgi:hypothetical protein
VNKELESIGYGKKRSWPDLRSFPGIYVVRLRETTRNLSQDSRSAGQDLNPGSLKYRTGVLTIKTGRSVLTLGTISDNGQRST